MGNSTQLKLEQKGNGEALLVTCGQWFSEWEHWRCTPVKKREETEVKSVANAVFEQFKCTRNEKEDTLGSCDDVKFGSSGTDANGSGWWDCNVAGIDNEEVASNEVWEGIGSTTLGGLDWN
ncbi:hypothetical protein Vadar_023280 [Vaccinium darrowii]|uniref:Uncharacterized protein n=1 Tax=Vaccinium darrowii TaxID=229202 RepID=A0ACB7X389_9ERIC|nr:hypothetical protein Vadar_023280 [Vaccinium darrowii]